MRVGPEGGGRLLRDGVVHCNTCDTRPNSVRAARSCLDLAVGGGHRRRDEMVHGRLTDGSHVRGRFHDLQEARTGVEMVKVPIFSWFSALFYGKVNSL